MEENIWFFLEQKIQSTVSQFRVFSWIPIIRAQRKHISYSAYFSEEILQKQNYFPHYFSEITFVQLMKIPVEIKLRKRKEKTIENVGY